MKSHVGGRAGQGWGRGEQQGRGGAGLGRPGQGRARGEAGLQFSCAVMNLLWLQCEAASCQKCECVQGLL